VESKWSPSGGVGECKIQEKWMRKRNTGLRKQSAHVLWSFKLHSNITQLVTLAKKTSKIKIIFSCTFYI